MAKGKRSPVKVVLLALLLVVAVYGVFVGVSVMRVKGQIDEAVQAYDDYEHYLDKKEIGNAVQSLESLAHNVGEIEREADSFTWRIARNIPYLGEDVSCVQQVAVISDRLANDALLPILKEVEDIAGVLDEEGLDLNSITNLLLSAPDQVMDIVDALAKARTVVSECDEAADALPESHFEQVNELVEKMRTALDEGNATLDALEPVFSGANFLSTLLSGE